MGRVITVITILKHILYGHLRAVIDSDILLRKFV